MLSVKTFHKKPTMQVAGFSISIMLLFFCGFKRHILFVDELCLYLHEQTLMVIFFPWSEQRYGMKNEAMAKSVFSVQGKTQWKSNTCIWIPLRHMWRSFSQNLSSDKTRSNGHKWKCRGLHLNVWKHLSTVRMTKHWRWLPRMMVESPSVEIVKTQLNNHSRCLCLSRRLVQVTLRDPFQAQLFCDSEQLFPVRNGGIIYWSHLV